MDPVIVLFARVTLAGGRNQWIRSVQRAIHTHDVRSMTLAGPKLLSGGTTRIHKLCLTLIHFVYKISKVLMPIYAFRRIPPRL